MLDMRFERCAALCVREVASVVVVKIVGFSRSVLARSSGRRASMPANRVEVSSRCPHMCLFDKNDGTPVNRS